MRLSKSIFQNIKVRVFVRLKVILLQRKEKSTFSMAQKVYRAKKALSILLGTCVPSAKTQASKIRIRKMELDENLLMVSLNRLTIPSLTKHSFL